MTSINTNSGAMTALQMLGGTVQSRAEVQDAVATGREINSAKDNAALWAISQIMETDAAAFKATSKTLSLGEATVAVSAVGAEQIAETVMEMKELAITAASGLVDYSKIEAQMQQKTDQINSIISSTQFNGVSLLKSDVNGSGATSLSVAASLDRDGSGGVSLSMIDVGTVDFEGDPAFDINGRSAITDQASAMAALGEIEGFLQFAVNGAAALGSSANRIAGQNETVSKLADATRMGISSMVDTNMEEASVRLAALSVQQQLGTMSLSIANYSPQSLGVLF
ncbi:flagellin N-terminal helical domain-containing protein [Phycobacter azelaicus]|uniref:flagellin N-terminal helical domain-containing protein n=1 Tax=Phycobacter azelaicus TaxID=2668075 RepID=UPI001867CDDE|nr:flagellin [Phycobacter azelaicus]MBE1295561.1 flagellin [Paracoccaceae bacterium]